jgi:transcriptional regulator with XRE-family HTH domain
MSVKKNVSQLIHVLAQNVRSLRKAKGMSLQTLIEKSGVSKRMLNMIEKGETNPSVRTIDSIAQALEVSFGDLISSSSQQQVHLYAPSDFTLKKLDRKGSLTRVLTTTPPRPLELWEWQLEPGAVYTATPDTPGSQAILLVLAGEVTVETNNEHHVISKGSAVRFASDRPYRFTAHIKKKTHFVASFLVQPIR